MVVELGFAVVGMGFAVVDGDTFCLTGLVGSTGCVVLFGETNDGWPSDDDGDEDIKFEDADTFADAVTHMDGDGLRNTVADEQTKIKKGLG